MIPEKVQERLDRMQAGDETAMGYEPEMDEQRYLVPDGLPRSAPPPFTVSSYRQTPIYSQQGGTCVGNSISGERTHSAFQETGEIFAFDGEALNARITHAFDQPTSFTPVMDDLLRSGVQPVQGEGLFFPQAYANVDWHDSEAVRTAISTPGQMCVFATWIGPGFGEHPRLPQPPMPDGPGKGLHAMLLVGYLTAGVIIQNNWSRTWGDEGHAVLSWEYVDAHFVEIMAITDRPDVAGGYIKTHQYDDSAAETAIARYDLPDRKRPAVYRVLDNGREWIRDPTAAKRLGVRLPPVRVPDTDPRWALPVIGPDAPRSQR